MPLGFLSAGAPVAAPAAPTLREVLHDFRAEETNELSVVAGELVEVLSGEEIHGVGWSDRTSCGAAGSRHRPHCSLAKLTLEL